jgi:hypothetical protein
MSPLKHAATRNFARARRSLQSRLELEPLQLRRPDQPADMSVGAPGRWPEPFPPGMRRVAVKPSTALGVAAVLENRERFAGRRVATILCGSNVTTDDFARWALGNG